MRPHLESLVAVLKDVGAANDSGNVSVSWQWYWASYLGTSTNCGIDNLLRRLIDDLIVIGLEADADALSGFFYHLGVFTW